MREGDERRGEGTSKGKKKKRGMMGRDMRRKGKWSRTDSMTENGDHKKCTNRLTREMGAWT